MNDPIPYRLLLVGIAQNEGSQITRELALALGRPVQFTALASPAVARLRAAREHFAALVAPLDLWGESVALAADLRSLEPRLPVVLVEGPLRAPRQRMAALRGGLMVVSDGKGQLLSALARALEPAVRVARRTGPEAPREQGRSQGAPSMGRAETGAMAAVLRRLGGSAGVQAAVVASLDGTVVADWQRTSELDVAELAPLAAGSLVATLQVGRLLGSRGLSSLMLQEHDGLLVMIARLRDTHLLLLAVEGEAAVGPLRLAMRRTIERLGGLLPAPRQREGAFAD